MRPLLLALLLSALPPVEAFADGRVEIRVTDHRAGIEDFRAFTISIAEVALHQSGQPRRQGWMAVLRGSSCIDLVPLKNGKWAAAGFGRVPAGRYDAIRVMPELREARHRYERPVAVKPAGATLVFDDAIEIKRGALLPVLLDFYVEDQTDHAPPRYVLKLRHVGVGDRGN